MSHVNVFTILFRLSRLSAFIYLSSNITDSLASDYFSPEFIETRGSVRRDIDVSRFNNSDGQIPGVYRVDVYMNGNYLSSQDITFVDNKGRLIPLLTFADMVKWGLSVMRGLNGCTWQKINALKISVNCCPGVKLISSLMACDLISLCLRNICNGILVELYRQSCGMMD